MYSMELDNNITFLEKIIFVINFKIIILYDISEI